MLLLLLRLWRLSLLCSCMGGQTRMRGRARVHLSAPTSVSLWDRSCAVLLIPAFIHPP